MGWEERCQREAGTIRVRFPRTFLMASGAISTSLCNAFSGDSTFMEGRMSGRRRYTVWSEPMERTFTSIAHGAAPHAFIIFRLHGGN